MTASGLRLVRDRFDRAPAGVFRAPDVRCRDLRQAEQALPRSRPLPEAFRVVALSIAGFFFVQAREGKQTKKRLNGGTKACNKQNTKRGAEIFLVLEGEGRGPGGFPCLSLSLPSCYSRTEQRK